VGRIPVGWEVYSCNSICVKVTDGEHLSPKYTDTEGMPILSAKDIIDYGIDFSDAKFVSKKDFKKMLTRCNPEKDDILIVSRGATIGKVSLNITEREFALMGSVILLKTNATKCKGNFLAYYLMLSSVKKEILQLSGSSAQQAIYLKDIKNLLVPIPPLPEQQKIAAILTSIDTNIEQKQTKLTQTKNLKNP
jgi:type I restriction enzyme S subunit